jgi:transposase
MWTRANRGRMADLEKKTKRYPTDLTDEEWRRIASFLPNRARRGRKPGVEMREVLNAIRYMARSGGGWRMLPKDFPPWQTVYWWFRRFVRLLLFRTVHDVALMMDRERVGREASPTAGVIDSQSVKAPHAKQRGHDAGKKITGRKRHIAVDTDGRLLMVNLSTADISDSAGAQKILDAIRNRWPWLKHLFADGAYDRGKLMDKAAFLDFVIEIVRRIDAEPGFKVLPRRWVVERTFGWMTRWRRLVRDYETRCDVSEAMIHVAMGSLLLRADPESIWVCGIACDSVWGADSREERPPCGNPSTGVPQCGTVFVIPAI